MVFVIGMIIGVIGTILLEFTYCALTINKGNDDDE